MASTADPAPTPPTDLTTDAAAADLDPRRWITLGILLIAVLIAGLDSTVLNVAIPTILREFDTTLPSLQWVVTGYSLTFAALLIIGGRLGDIFGARRMFIIGAALFGVGSLLASVANGVVVLVIGESIIEGTGASLMLPATMGILSGTFRGRERATAFAAWGAVIGAAVAFGPVLGGFLTTNYSWRWAFRINVIVAPVAILGALLFMPKTERAARRQGIDVPGALLIASGMFLLVFAISEGRIYGWLTPKRDFDVVGATVWPSGLPVSVVAVALVLSIVLLLGFHRVQRAKERAGTDPLFEFSNLERPAFRWGTATLLVLASGQVAFLLVVSVVLQDGRHLSAVDTGLWLVPSGVAIVLGSQVGNRLTRIVGTTHVVRIGLVVMAAGMGSAALAITPSLTFWTLLPGFLLFGTGIGFAGAQLNNVILSGIPPERSGAASGANTTVRMIGASLGIAVISSLLTVESAGGTGVDRAVIDGARSPLAFATIALVLGAGLSFLIPQVGPRGARQGAGAGADDETELEREASELLAETVTTA